MSCKMSGIPVSEGLVEVRKNQLTTISTFHPFRSFPGVIYCLYIIYYVFIVLPVNEV